jgi:hypothetical protein
MDLMQIMRENANARKIILSQNLAETARKYGLALSDARKVHNYAAMLEAA